MPAPAAAVFAAIRDPERLARWWGPDGFSSTFRVFEFGAGGRWHFTRHGPDGTDHPTLGPDDFLERAMMPDLACPSMVVVPACR